MRERGVSAAQAARDLDVHENVLRKWVKEFGSDPVQAFPGRGQMKPEQQEIDRLRREVQKLRAERDNLYKGRSLLREESEMKFVFIAKHRKIWPVAWLCDALGVSRSGFHAWLNRSPSARSRSDELLGERVKASFLASDRTYGARRVWRDVLAAGAAELAKPAAASIVRSGAGRNRVRRRGRPNALLHHSDQGSQYKSEQFQRLMADSGVACSMSRSGNVWDNAAMESFFSSLKTERIARKIYRTRNEAKPMCSTTSSGSKSDKASFGDLISQPR